MENLLFNEVYGIVGVIPPTDTDAPFSGYIDMADFEEIFAVALMGDMSAHAIDFLAIAYTDQLASDATTIKECTQLAANAGTNDNDIVAISVRNQDILAKSTSSKALRYVRLSLASAGQTGFYGAVIFGKPYAGLGSAHNLAAVVEVEDDLS